MKILITGINGLLGNVLVRRLIEKHEIFALVKKNKEKIVHKNLKIIETDLKFFNEKKLPKKIDFIIHLAQSNFYNNFPEDGEDIFDVNVRSTFNLLNFAYKNKIKNFLYTSTGDVLLRKEMLFYDNFYITSKYISELLINKYQNFFNCTILRLFGLYGENQKKGLIYNLIKRTDENKKIFLNGVSSGDLLFLTHVEDCAECINFFINKKIVGVFDIAPEKNISIKKVCEIISKKKKLNVNIIYKKRASVKVYKPKLNKLKKIYDISKFRDSITGLNQIL